MRFSRMHTFVGNYARPPVPFASRSTLSLLEINANEAAVGGLVTPVKGSYVGYVIAGRRSVRGNSKSALLGTVCGASAFASLSSSVAHKRAYNVQWIRERNAGSFREHGVYFIPCRVAIKLRGAINHLRQCEETDFADGLRVFGIRFDIQLRANCLLRSKLMIDRYQICRWLRVNGTASFCLLLLSRRTIRR